MAVVAAGCLKWRMTVASLAAENTRLQALLAETQAALAESEEARRRLVSIGLQSGPPIGSQKGPLCCVGSRPEAA